MDPVSSSSPSTLSDDYSASRQADTIEAGSILISLANSHKPSTDKQELEAAAVAMESMSKHHHRTYSLENRHHLTPIAPAHSMENEYYRRPPSSSMSIHNLLSDDRSSMARLESPPVRAMNRRRSSVEDQKAPVQYLTSPPIIKKRSLDTENHPMPMKRPSISKDGREYSIPHHQYPSEHDRHANTTNPASSYSNSRQMYRPNVDDPYRSRKDHKYRSDAYRYEHTAQPSNNGQQRQPQSPAIIQRKSSMLMPTSLPQKYFAMKQSPKVKRNATHAYISYTIYMDITRKASIKNQLMAEDAHDRAHGQQHYYHPTQTSPTLTIDRPMYADGQDRNRKQSQTFYNRSIAPPESVDYHRRQSSMTYPPPQYPSSSLPSLPNERHVEPPSTTHHPPPRYRPPPVTESYPPQELLSQPLTAYLRDRNNHALPR